MTSDLDRLARRSVRRRDFMRYAGIAAGAGILAACKNASTPATGPTGSGGARPTIEQEPGSLQVFDWSGYGNGDYYPDKERVNLWQSYVDATGDTPQFVLFENDDAGFTKVATGTHYDVVHPCAYRFKDYVDLGVLQPWDTSLIPNFASLNPSLEGQGVIDGKQYFIVEDWGFIAPLYRADKVQPTEDSWSLLWDDRYEGRISWIDTLEMLVIAGYYHGVPDPWTMTDDELAQMRDFLISKKHLVRFLWDQSFELWQGFKRDEVWIGYSWPDTVGYALTAGMDVVYMEPKESRISWTCGFGLFKDTANYYHAHEYVNSWSSTKAAAFLEAWYYYGHANTSVDLSLIPEAIVKAFSLDDLSVLEPPRSVVESWISRRDVYGQYWSEVLAA
ncbi:MAG TPA: extracellular solute-binding protein [Actinomycetota bacterium]|jgi:spermidine/putrescine transport system substrate-binding protein